MSTSPVEVAVQNNICWYQALFDAHGIAHESDAQAWQSLQTPPPFHSNLVVRAREAREADIEARMEVISCQLAPDFPVGLKDSFASLDLTRAGFQTLFSAQWIWLPEEAGNPRELDSTLMWSRVDSPTELAAWEDAWHDAPVNTIIGARPRQFPDSLLGNADFAFLSGRLRGDVVAGAVVNRSPGAAGLSNFFVRAGYQHDIWPSLVRLAREAFPGRPLTGYAHGDVLTSAQRVGFAPVGELRVLWRPPKKDKAAVS